MSELRMSVLSRMLDTFDECLKARNRLDDLLDQIQGELDEFPRLPDGRVSDATKELLEYKDAKSRHGEAFSMLRHVNTLLTGKFAAEYRNHRKIRR